MYAPNNESKRALFLEKLQQMTFKHVINPDNIIMAGDFNCCLNLSDRFPVSARSDKSVKSFANLMQNCKLIDSWLQSNPGNPDYTYFDKKSNSYSRLDYILLSQDIKFKTKNIKITQLIKNPGVVDHSAVKLVFEARNFKKGPGYWKLNNSILTDAKYLMETKRVIEKTIEEYKSLKSCQLIWELVKINVKDYTICYCKNKAQDRTRATRSIQKDLDIVNENILNLEVKEHISNEEIIKLNNLKVKKIRIRK